MVIAHGCGTYSIYMVLNRLSGKLAHLQDELLARGWEVRDTPEGPVLVPAT